MVLSKMGLSFDVLFTLCCDLGISFTMCVLQTCKYKELGQWKPVKPGHIFNVKNKRGEVIEPACA